MDRRKELVEYIKEEREKRRQKMKTFFAENILEIIPSFQDKFRSLINEQVKKQRNGNIKFVFLCQTLSSGYTGSNEAILGMSSDMLIWMRIEVKCSGILNCFTGAWKKI